MRMIMNLMFLILIFAASSTKADGIGDLRKVMLEAKKMEADAKQMAERAKKQQAKEYITSIAQMKRQQQLNRIAIRRSYHPVIYVCPPYAYTQSCQQINNMIRHINQGY